MSRIPVCLECGKPIFKAIGAGRPRKTCGPKCASIRAALRKKRDRYADKGASFDEDLAGGAT